MVKSLSMISSFVVHYLCRLISMNGEFDKDFKLMTFWLFWPKSVEMFLKGVKVFYVVLLLYIIIYIFFISFIFYSARAIRNFHVYCNMI